MSSLHHITQTSPLIEPEPSITTYMCCDSASYDTWLGDLACFAKRHQTSHVQEEINFHASIHFAAEPPHVNEEYSPEHQIIVNVRLKFVPGIIWLHVQQPCLVHGPGQKMQLEADVQLEQLNAIEGGGAADSLGTQQRKRLRIRSRAAVQIMRNSVRVLGLGYR